MCIVQCTLYTVHCIVYIHKCTHMHPHIHIYTYIHTHTPIHTYTNTHPDTPTQTHIQKYTHTHITLHYIIDTAITACLCKYLPLEGRDEVGWAIFGHRVINYHNRYHRFARHICVELNILKMK